MPMLSHSKRDPNRQHITRRVPEWRRPSTFRARLISLSLKWLLYFMLIPSMLSGGVIGASLELGSTWGEAFKNVSLVAQTTLSTYETHLDLIELSAQVLLKLDGEAQASDLDMITYAAEVRSRTSALSAEIDKALADYLKRQVERSRQRATADRPVPSSAEPVTLEEVLGGGVFGALIPLLMYWLLSYALTRWWLIARDRETLSLYTSSI